MLDWLHAFLLRAGLTAICVAIALGCVMAKEMTAAEHRAHLDRVFPIVEAGEDPPGRWITGDAPIPGVSGVVTPGVRRWSGKMHWSTRHGDAVVRRFRGDAVFVSNAVLPDKTPVDVNGPHPWRYRVPNEPRRWVHGTVEIGNGGVAFIPGDQPTYDPPPLGDHPDLEADLARDAGLRKRLVDPEFADTFYAFLKNGDFFKEGGERIWMIGLSSAASLVARLRGQGDTYTDYYPHGGAVKLAWFDEITDILRALGWRRATAEDKATAAIYTRRDLAVLEERSSSSPPEGAQKLTPPNPPRGRVVLRAGPARELSDHERQRHEEIVSQSLRNRLNALAASGRITEDEYRSMLRRINQIP